MPKLQIQSYEQAKRFYDWIGAKQDMQCFYEGPAPADLVDRNRSTVEKPEVEGTPQERYHSLCGRLGNRGLWKKSDGCRWTLFFQRWTRSRRR
jgi:hypothetical protein